MSTPENPPAFATEPNTLHHGMSLRDYFAAQGLPALISRPRADVAWAEVATTAYSIADAMLAERAKEHKP